MHIRDLSPVLGVVTPGPGVVSSVLGAAASPTAMMKLTAAVTPAAFASTMRLPSPNGIRLALAYPVRSVLTLIARPLPRCESLPRPGASTLNVTLTFETPLLLASRTRARSRMAWFTVPLREREPSISILSATPARPVVSGVVSGVVPGAGIVMVGESLNPGALAYTVCALVALGSVTLLLTDLEALGIMIVRGLATPLSVTINPPLGIVPPEAVTVIDCCVPDRVPTVLIARVPGADTVIFIVAEVKCPVWICRDKCIRIRCAR